MKIAVPSTRADLNGKVESKLGGAAYLLLIETDDMSFEVLGGPSSSSGRGAGIIALSQVLNMGAKVVLVGVIMLLGLFRGFVSEETLLSLFSQSTLHDSLWGASLGSMLAGNPVNSYVIGKSLLTAGVGLAGVTALMLAWVNVGLIQLPAEAAALGLRFALVRNVAGFVMAIMMSFVVVLWKGWIV